MSKTCSKCKITKTFSEFNQSNPTKKDGYNSWCKQCARDASKRHSKTPSGIYSQLNGRINYALNHQGEKHNGYSRGCSELKITREAFIEWYDNEPKICVYCSLPEEALELVNDQYIKRTIRLTIDRADNNKEYESGNMVLSCKRCNALKSDFFDYYTFRALAQMYIKPEWERRLGFRLT